LPTKKSEEECLHKKAKMLETFNDEYISASEDEVRRESKRKETILIPSRRIDGKIRCKGRYHNGDKRGQMCDKYIKKGDLCAYHKKQLSKDESPDTKQSNGELKRKLEQLETNCLREIAKNREDRDKVKKLEKEIESLKKSAEKCIKIEKDVNELKQSLREFRTGQQEISNKLDYLLKSQNTGKSSTMSTDIELSRRRIKKLDNTIKYKLLGLQQDDAVLEGGNEVFKLIVPKELGKPDEKKKLNLTYNESSKRFEWKEV